MSEPVLDAFGQAFIEQSRDPSIVQWDHTVTGQMKGAYSQRMYERLKSLDSEQMEAVRTMIPGLVDLVLHNVLWMLERAEAIHIGIDTDAGLIPDIREVALGDLQGYLYDWIPRFSGQRYEPPA